MAPSQPDLQVLIEHQWVQIEWLRAQIAAFEALASAIQAGGNHYSGPVEMVIRREA